MITHYLCSFLAYGCANPVIAPPEHNLNFTDYVNDTVKMFGDIVTYECLPDHYMVTDHDQQFINTECKTDKSGTWTTPPFVDCITEDRKLPSKDNPNNP